MHGAHGLLFHLVETAFEIVYAIGDGLVGPAREQGLIDLNPAAAGLGQGADLAVDRLGQDDADRALIVIEIIGD